jgi:hypothetical protein
MRHLSVVIALVLAGSVTLQAQFGVHDAAVTTRNRITAVIREYLLEFQRAQHEKLRRMARRLSAQTNLDKYSVANPPPWQARAFDDVLFSQSYNQALSRGDPDGAGYLAVSHPVVAARELLARLSPAGERALSARLATIDLADAAAIAATNDVGRLRANGGRGELPAIDALDRHVIDPSEEQSATAVLDKISGAVLIGARQRQARMQLLTGVVEQLLVDSKRTRDTEAMTMNGQLVTLRDGRAANEAFVAGAGDALRNWRQP